MHMNQKGGGGKTSNRNTRSPPTLQASNEQRQGQPHKPLPEFYNKYFWTHGECAHEGSSSNNKTPKHQDTATFSRKRSGSTYGCTWQGGSTSLMILNTDNKINLLQKKNKIGVDPPPQIIVKADTGSTSHYYTQADSHALIDVQQQQKGSLS